MRPRQETTPAPADRGAAARPASLVPLLQLADVLAPLDAATFYERHWSGQEPFLSRPSQVVRDALRSVSAIASVDAVLARHRGTVTLFGPGSSRRVVEAPRALAALANGSNVYIPRVEEHLPDVRDLFRDLAAGLGVAPWQLSVEAFAGKAGGVSSRHYDHDVNFQFLLEGEKQWILEPNRHIENPTRAFHPTADDGDWKGFCEEAYARDPRLPADFDPEHSQRLRAAAGTALFLPRGMWHEVTSLTDTWAINLVVKGVTWAEALGRALVAHLHHDPRFRGYCDSYRGRGLGEAHSASRSHTFEALKVEAATALATLPLVELELSPLGARRCAWRPGAEARRVDRRGGRPFLVAPGFLPEPLPLREDVVPIVQRLCAFRHPFQFAHARAALPEASPAAVYGTIALLSKYDLVRIGEPHVSQ